MPLSRELPDTTPASKSCVSVVVLHLPNIPISPNAHSPVIHPSITNEMLVTTGVSLEWLLFNGSVVKRVDGGQSRCSEVAREKNKTSTTKCVMSLRSPPEHEKEVHPSKPPSMFGEVFGRRQIPSCRHRLPASRLAGCVRRHPCQRDGFRQSMPERRARVVMFKRLTQV